MAILESAEQLWKRIIDSRIDRGETAAAAEAARNQGALAFLHDTSTAIDHYERAVELEPGNPDGWNQLGHLCLRVGNLRGAEGALRKVWQAGRGTPILRTSKGPVRRTWLTQSSRGSGLDQPDGSQDFDIKRGESVDDAISKRATRWR